MVCPIRSAVIFALFFNVASRAIFRNDALGQIALGQSGQHLNEIAQRLRDIVAQAVDQGADVENQSGLAFQRDPPREIAGCRSLDDVADRRLEFIGHFRQRSLALGFGAPILLGLLGGFALRLLGRPHFELVDGLGDVADFVFACEPGKHDVEVAGGELAHALRQRRDRVGDPACQEEGDQGADQQGQRSDDFLDLDRRGDRALGSNFAPRRKPLAIERALLRS
jgi:hypothetical protein